jgi:hypothetical protein
MLSFAARCPFSAPPVRWQPCPVLARLTSCSGRQAIKVASPSRAAYRMRLPTRCPTSWNVPRSSIRRARGTGQCQRTLRREPFVRAWPPPPTPATSRHTRHNMTRSSRSRRRKIIYPKPPRICTICPTEICRGFDKAFFRGSIEAVYSLGEAKTMTLPSEASGIDVESMKRDVEEPLWIDHLSLLPALEVACPAASSSRAL